MAKIDSMTNARGELLRKYKPAVYLDASFIIHYWQSRDAPERPPERHTAFDHIVEDIMFSRYRVETLKMRERLGRETPSVTPIVSSLALLEFIGWYSGLAFKRLAQQTPAGSSVQGAGWKELSAYMQRVLQRRRSADEASRSGQSGDRGIQQLWDELWPRNAFTEDGGLANLLPVGVHGLSVSYEDAWSLPGRLALMQMGLADAVHVLAASHLGCQYIGTLDKDYVRSAEQIKDQTGVEVVYGSEDVAALLFRRPERVSRSRAGVKTAEKKAPGSGRERTRFEKKQSGSDELRPPKNEPVKAAKPITENGQPETDAKPKRRRRRKPVTEGAPETNGVSGVANNGKPVEIEPVLDVPKPQRAPGELVSRPAESALPSTPMETPAEEETPTMKPRRRRRRSAKRLDDGGSE